MEFGSLVVFRKGKSSAPYELEEGEHSIGSSKDSNIRLKFSHPLLMETHALIRVNENGVATIINKSVGAPVRVNGKKVLRPVILRHEDKFEILEKVFQYFNEHLKDEPEDSDKFVEEKKNILATSRQSVHPLIKTPAKKSPNLKTKIPLLRKSASAVSRHTKGLQVIITPSKKPDSHAGSQTTSKIIVSKALVSPRSAKKRRLSLDNLNKASEGPKISSRNILLSKSTINITISEEHEYSEVTPSKSMKTIQEDEIPKEDLMENKSRTPRRSVKVEKDISTKDISVALIDFNSPGTPAVNSSGKGRTSSVKKSLHHSAVETDLSKEPISNENSTNIMKTPINKRIQSLKTVRHSLKKDTPPPRLNVPKVAIHPPTPQGRRVTEVSPNGNSDISITYSPNAEPSTCNSSQKENKTPRRSITKKFEGNGTPANKSSVSFAIEAPTEASPINFEALNDSDLTDKSSDVLTSADSTKKQTPQHTRTSKGSRSIVNNESGTRNSRMFTKSQQSLTADELEQVLEGPKSRRSSRYSFNSTRKLEDSSQDNSQQASVQKASRVSQGNRLSKTEDVLLVESPDNDEELYINLSKRKTGRYVSGSTEGSSAEKQNSARKSGSRAKNDKESLLNSSKYSRDMSRTSAKVDNDRLLSEGENLSELLDVGSDEEMDELQLPEKSPDTSVSKASTSNIEENISNSKKSLNISNNVSTRSTKLEESTRLSRNVPRTSSSNATDKDGISSPERSVRISSRRSVQLNTATNSSLHQGNAADSKETSPEKLQNSNNVFNDPRRHSRLSRNVSVRSNVLDQSDNSLLLEKETTDSKIHGRNSYGLSRNTSKLEAVESLDFAADAADIENIYTFRNVPTTKKVEESATSSLSEDEVPNYVDNLNKSSRLPRNASRRSSKIGGAASSSQTEDNTTDDEQNISKSSKISRNASISSKNKALAYSSQSMDNTSSPEENVIKSFRMSRNTSRRSSKIELLVSSSQTEDNTTDAEENVNKSPRRSSKIKVLANSFQSEDNTTDAGKNINKCYRKSRNTSGSSSVLEMLASSSLSEDDTTDTEENAKKSSRVSRNRARNISRRSSKNDAFNNSSQTTDAEENVHSSSRISRNASRRSSKIKVLAGSSKIENHSPDAEDNVNKSSRESRNLPRQNRNNQEAVYSSQTEDNTTDTENSIKSRSPKYSSRKSRNLERSSRSLLTNNDTINADKSYSQSSRLSKSMSQDRPNMSGIAQLSVITPDKSSRNVSRRSTRALNSQSSIDSTETTMDVQHKNGKESDTSSRTKNRSQQGLSLFDESTQEAKSSASTSKNRSRQRVSIFDESTREVLPKLDKSKSEKKISNLDDTQEVLSPVRPLSPRKSIRNIQNQKLEESISPSARVSSIRRSRTTLQDSSLTMTSLDQSSSSVISVSSQSFSSFKRGSSRKEETHNETEIDVVNISSTMEMTEVKKSSRTSVSNVKNEVLDESNVSRSSKRLSRTSEMFKDVSCTSTPFHKQNLSKQSQETNTSESKNSTQKSASSSAVSSSEHPDVISISSASDSVFMHSSAEKRSRSSSNVYDVTAAVRRRSSSRNSVSRQGGEHNCISCRNSSVKRSRSLSATGQASIVEGRKASSSSRSSKTPRTSSDSVFEQSYEETSPVKKSSSAAFSKTTTPLLHRKSLATSLSEKTPEKSVETEDETPKSSIKPTRRSSKANQSAYNPLLEDITPVTPERLMVSGFTEDVFKTPINTPGLFENIRKSVIRSRKRHRESTGSTMKDSKRARVDFTQEEQQLVTSSEVEHLQQKPQRSPVNRLSNFEGVKKLMRSPPKSPKNDLRNIPNLRKLVSPKEQASPKNDLTNVAGVKKMFTTPKDVKSPKNDLTNIPNLRRLVSPKRQNSPKNDLRQIPNLKRLMSPKQQNSPKNDISSPVGVKQLLKSPRTQKEPSNDLGNVTGVASIFNVSGVEVLHQGSDIENSEDLFTKLTGKAPIRAYPRGKSMSPNKEETQGPMHSRKTMGDIPVCSPRVQQWVEDHANVMYTSIEESRGTLLNKDKGVFNISEKPQRRSRKGRSVSPNKTVQDTKNRRKTQGDVLGDSPNVTTWKADQTTQVKTRKLSITTNTKVKSEILSPWPAQALQTVSTKAENVTPQQQKSKTEILTPQQQRISSGNTASPASVKSRRGARKLAAEAQQEPGVQKKTITSSKVEIEELPEIVVTKDQTPKKIENKPLESLRRGGRGKRIMSAEELNVVSSTTVSPVQEVVAKKTRTRRDAAKIEAHSNDQEEKCTPEISAKTLSKKRKTAPECEPASNDILNESVEETVVKKRTRGRPRKNKVDDVQSTPVINASPVKRGGRRGVKVMEDTPIENEQVSEKEIEEKPAARSRRGRKINNEHDTPMEDVAAENVTPLKKPVAKGKVIKKDNKDQDTDNAKNIAELPAVQIISKGKRGQKVDEGNQTDVASSQVDDKKVASGRRGRKIDIIESTEVKELQEQVVDTEIKIPAPKGKKGEKKKPQESEIDNAIAQKEEPEVKKPSKGRRGKKTVEEEAVETEIVNVTEQTEEPDVKKTLRSRKGKKIEDNDTLEKKQVATLKPTINKESADDTDTDVEFNKPSRSRVKKGAAPVSTAKDITNQMSPPKRTTRRGALRSKDETELTPSSPVAKTTRGGKRGAKLVVDVTDQSDVEERKVTEKAPTKRGGRKKIEVNEPESEQETDDNAKVESLKKAIRGKGKNEEVVENAKKSTKKGGKSIKSETQEAVESPKKAPTRGRGKKVTEETTEDHVPSQKQNTRKPRNKVIDDVIEMDIDSPRTARAKRGINKKYSTEEYEVLETKNPSKRKVRFEDEDDDASKKIPEVDTRKSKRTRK